MVSSGEFADYQDTRLLLLHNIQYTTRDLAVVELPRAGAPLPPALFSERLHLPLTRVAAILDELEQHETFLFRKAAGAVTWAYPVTLDPTPHRISLSTGERINAA